MAGEKFHPATALRRDAMLSHRDITRRRFLRRMLGASVGLLSLEFLGGSFAFLWPNLSGGLGGLVKLGSVDAILETDPDFGRGYPHAVAAASSFLVNVPAPLALASGSPIERTPMPSELLALWRKCPHLGCMVPPLCAETKRFECRCHGSTYNVIGEKLLKGPAERGMDRFTVLVDDDGTVVIDAREIVRGAPEGTATFHDPFPPDVGCR
jgi:cytochrome b6-f complex iron-sulfur subunit